MKTILSLATVLSFAVTAQLAHAGKPTKVKPMPPTEPGLKMNFGEAFDLKTRRTALPTESESLAPKLLTHNQVDKVVKDRIDELEYCWLRVPAQKRTQTSAIVKLSVEAIGIVQNVVVDGELPAGVAKCMTTVAQRWRFPVGEQASEIEYPIALNSLAARETPSAR